MARRSLSPRRFEVVLCGEVRPPILLTWFPLVLGFVFGLEEPVQFMRHKAIPQQHAPVHAREFLVSPAGTKEGIERRPAPIMPWQPGRVGDLLAIRNGTDLSIDPVDDRVVLRLGEPCAALSEVVGVIRQLHLLHRERIVERHSMSPMDVWKGHGDPCLRLF